MSPEEKALLERTYKLVEENNGMLRSMRRSQRIGTVMRVVYWALIIISSFGAYYLIQPYLDGIRGQATTSMNTVKDFTDTFNSLTQ